MRRTRKILAAIFAMIMVLSMSMTASAATIIVDDGQTEGSTYHAYKLLNAKYAEADSDSEEPMIVYTLNEKYANALRTVTGYTEGSDIVDYIGSLGSTAIREFADNVYAEIKSMSADYTTTTNGFVDIEQGYYLIVETVKGDETYSLVMLDTAGDKTVTVTTKEGVPELVKKVKEQNDTDGMVSDWQDGADYDIGDAVPFQLTGTVSAQYENYATYYYAFHDTLSAGLTFDPTSVVVKVENTEGFTVISEGYEVITENLEDGCSFEVRFADLKTVKSVNKDSKIVVEYNVELTEKAVIGPEGNPNVAKLEYCNNPYFNGTVNGDESDDGSGDGTDDEGSTSETPEDKVIVFTYELDINKVDASGNPLEGAGFTLYKMVKADDAAEPEYIAVGEEKVGTTDSPMTSFQFAGLDAGQYKLVETTVPASYSKADDIEFTITASYDTEAVDPTFTENGLVVTMVSETNTEVKDVFSILEGVISANVVNMKGLILPSTGGIGTTIFYIAGAVIMIGAAVLFIRCRRMEEKK